MAGSSVSVEDQVNAPVAVVMVRVSREDLIESSDQAFSALLAQLKVQVETQIRAIRDRERLKARL